MSGAGDRRDMSVWSFLNPASFIRAAASTNRIFRSALGVAGLAAVVVIFVRFGVNYATLLFGVLAAFGLMILFAVVSRIREIQRAKLDLPALVLVWFFLATMCSFVILLTTSTFGNEPLPFRTWIEQKVGPRNGLTKPSSKKPAVLGKELTAADNVTNTLGRTQKILNMIMKTADDICKKPALKQTGNGVSLSRNAKAKVGGLVGELAKIDVSGTATNVEYSSVRVDQKHLARAIQASNNCSLTVFKILTKDLLNQ